MDNHTVRISFERVFKCCFVKSYIYVHVFKKLVISCNNYAKFVRLLILSVSS